ncbi:hypothetical protein QQ008_24240 [Fulvivirgaceae bacterium BMA10]|uniref:Uncharacterized protein n=1 Tax=Splendidivirga corallicola TaxID=3051826 RepID=A0ABT8KWJ0_9BACT|nr:hypothetical protein [Fulvivirgaceae bacterium BMA10]
MKSSPVTKIFLVVILITTSGSPIFSQSTDSKRSYKRGKVYLHDRSILTVKNLSIDKSSLSFDYQNQSKKINYALDDIKMVRVASGNYAGRGALIGGGTMLLASLRALSEIQRNPYLTTKDNAGEIIAGFIVGGSLMGALIGMAFPKWKTIFPSNNETSRHKRPGISTGLSASQNYVGLKFCLNF